MTRNLRASLKSLAEEYELPVRILAEKLVSCRIDLYFQVPDDQVVFATSDSLISSNPDHKISEEKQSGNNFIFNEKIKKTPVLEFPDIKYLAIEGSKIAALLDSSDEVVCYEFFDALRFKDEKFFEVTSFRQRVALNDSFQFSHPLVQPKFTLYRRSELPKKFHLYFSHFEIKDALIGETYVDLDRLFVNPTRRKEIQEKLDYLLGKSSVDPDSDRWMSDQMRQLQEVFDKTWKNKELKPEDVLKWDGVASDALGKINNIFKSSKNRRDWAIEFIRPDNFEELSKSTNKARPCKVYGKGEPGKRYLELCHVARKIFSKNDIEGFGKTLKQAEIEKILRNVPGRIFTIKSSSAGAAILNPKTERTQFGNRSGKPTDSSFK